MLNLASALSSPDWFLERFHIETSTFTMVRTTRDRLHEAAFHDGRTDLKVRPEVLHVEVDDALLWLENQKGLSKHRIIAHTSFCGSTLLARAIDVPQHVLVFREPQVLIDLANLKALNHGLSRNADLWPRLIMFVLKQLQKSWLPSQLTVIKPSNWANTLLPDISNLSNDIVFVLLSMDLRAYLIANLRGGKDRLKFSLDLLNHNLSQEGSYGGFAQRIQTTTYTPLQQTLCMLALCHAIQIQTFIDLDETAPDRYMWLSKPSLTGRPEETVTDAANHLDLSIPLAQLKANVAISTQYNSKMDGSKYFNRDSERNINATLGHAYKDDIRLALNWFEENFPDIANRTDAATRMTDSA